MRRMHAHSETNSTPEVKESVASEPASEEAPTVKPRPKNKRQASMTEHTFPEKKQKPSTSGPKPDAATPESHREKLQGYQKTLEQDWRQQRETMERRFRELKGPEDQQLLRELHKASTALSNLSGRWSDIKSQLKAMASEEAVTASVQG